MEGFVDEVASAMPFGICGVSGWRSRLAGARRSSCLASRRLDSTKEKASSSRTCFHQLGVGICIIDHHVGLMAELCARLVVLHFGNKIADGPTEAVLNDPKVIEGRSSA